MSTLSISNFSCLDDVYFEPAPVTAIIGPQGSGKSILTKMNFFCSEILNEHLTSAERGDSFDDFKRTLAKKFRLWFPPSAWGDRRLNVSYTSGDFSVRILRRWRSGKLSDELAFTFSDWFEKFYEDSASRFREAESHALDADLFAENAKNLSDPLEDLYRARHYLRARVRRRLGSDFISSQMFIPAGRAYFTSMGKLVAGLTNIGALDPLTVRFAEVFSELRNRNASRALPARVKRLGPDFTLRQKDSSLKFFGGEVVYESGAERVLAKDGRQIPFGALSSGQQETLPMWTAVQYLSELENIRRGVPNQLKEILYIEEPEAHLFPYFQSELLSYIFDSLSFSRRSRSLIMTTHSPYIMSRLNIFLKAGMLSRRKKKNLAINEIVPRTRWIQPRDFKAYAIIKGELKNIVDEDGMIDGSYLDSISNDIERDFDRLLSVEMEI